MAFKKLDVFYVIVQICLLALYLVDFKLFKINLVSNFSIKLIMIIFMVLGIIIVLLAILQLHKNLSPFPSPKTNSELITVGLYKYIRHPIYTGIIVITIGYGLYTNSVYKILIALGLSILFYFKSKYEEQQLSIAFKSYKNYKKEAGRFFPRLKKR